MEHLLILLKETWREMPEVRQGHRTDVHETFERVVTMCIKVYYGALDPV